MVEAICGALDGLLPAGAPHSQLITPVSDRPDHDRRYAIDPARISTELGWQQRHSFEEGLAATVLLVSGAAGLVPVSRSLISIVSSTTVGSIKDLMMDFSC